MGPATVLRYTALSAALALSACAGKAPPESDAPPRADTELEVVNRSSSDMDIYMARSGQRVRLGLAPANETTRFTLWPAQIAGVGTVHFQAAPLTGPARPISSEPVILRAGDVITLNIPPP